ncbi:MAG TPA: murein biosynthesis integral membrane protein MurJ [Alphaproteobacteria bacterium]|nr:murein biosynthesis integral membrane protein MurJ [Alphaproteobacteria bacterium]
MNFARSIITVGGMTVLSRITGFLRDTLAANILGAGPVADAFFVALRLPNLFRSLFAEGAFSAAFVPLYAKARKEGGEALARLFAGEALSVLVAVLLPFSILIIVFMPQAMQVLAPGFQDKPETYALVVEYGRITFPYLMLVSIVALLAGVLNSNKHFAPGAAAPICFNLLAVAALLLSRPLHQDPGLMMAISVAVSGLLQWLWLHVHCKAIGVAPKLALPRLTPRVKKLFAQVGPGALGAGATQINLAMSTVLASWLPTGTVSYLNYADRLNQLPLGVIGIAISTTLLPVLSARVQAEDAGGVRRYTGQALDFGLMLGLPAAIGLGIAATPIIHVLFEHGKFHAEDTAGTSVALAAYSFGILPFIIIKVLSTLFFAHHDLKTPVRIAIYAVVVNIAFAFLLKDVMGHAGIALATSLASWVNVTGLAIALKKRKLLHIEKSSWRRAGKILLSAAVMAVFLYLGRDYVEQQLRLFSKWVDVSLLFAYLLAALLVYSAALRLSGAMTLRQLKAIINKSEEYDGV